MRTLLSGVVFLLFLGSFCFAEDPTPTDVSGPSAQELFSQSDQAFETRHRAGNNVRSITLAEEALAKGGDEFEAKWRIARGCFWEAEVCGNEKCMTEYGEKGYKAGERAAELRPNRVEGWYWGVIALGQYSTGIGTFKAFFKGIAGTYEKMVEKAIALDKNYGLAGPLRAYGRYWYAVPKVKRDLAKSEAMLRESVALSPKKLRSHFYLAETYLAEEKRDLAKASLETCVNLKPEDEEYPDGIIFIKECRKLLEKEFK